MTGKRILPLGAKGLDGCTKIKEEWSLRFPLKTPAASPCQEPIEGRDTSLRSTGHLSDLLSRQPVLHALKGGERVQAKISETTGPAGWKEIPGALWRHPAFLPISLGIGAAAGGITASLGVIFVGALGGMSVLDSSATGIALAATFGVTGLAAALGMTRLAGDSWNMKGTLHTEAGSDGAARLLFTPTESGHGYQAGEPVLAADLPSSPPLPDPVPLKRLATVGERLPNGRVKAREEWRFTYTIPIEIKYPSGEIKHQTESHSFNGSPAELLKEPGVREILEHQGTINASLTEVENYGSLQGTLSALGRHKRDLVLGALSGIPLSLPVMIPSMLVAAIASSILGLDHGTQDTVLQVARWLTVPLTSAALGIGLAHMNQQWIVEGIVRQETGPDGQKRVTFIPVEDFHPPAFQGYQSYRAGEPVDLEIEPPCPSAPTSFQLPAALMDPLTLSAADLSAQQRPVDTRLETPLVLEKAR